MNKKSTSKKAAVETVAVVETPVVENIVIQESKLEEAVTMTVLKRANKVSIQPEGSGYTATFYRTHKNRQAEDYKMPAKYTSEEVLTQTTMHLVRPEILEWVGKIGHGLFLSGMECDRLRVQ